MYHFRRFKTGITQKMAKDIIQENASQRLLKANTKERIVIPEKIGNKFWKNFFSSNDCCYKKKYEAGCDVCNRCKYDRTLPDHQDTTDPTYP